MVPPVNTPTHLAVAVPSDQASLALLGLYLSSKLLFAAEVSLG